MRVMFTYSKGVRRRVPDVAHLQRRAAGAGWQDFRTEVTILCEGLPAAIRPEDNEAGTEQALEKLAVLVAV
jgi:hypothetical protein